MAKQIRIGFIGGGNMAAALVGGLVGKLTAADHIHVVDINQDALQRLQSQFGVSTSLQINAALAACDVIVLAVKPQQMREAAMQLKPYLQSQLILSIAAGIRAADLSRWLSGHEAVVRTMPNTPALVGLGMTGMAAMRSVTSRQREQAEAIMRAVGKAVWLDEEAQLDPVTAISGSGPAYVFYFIEAMQQAAREMGLTEAQGTELAIETFRGAVQLAANSVEPISVLRERVTSKGGTTHAALTIMEQSGVKDAIVRAAKAAAHRGRELGEEFGKA